MTVDSRVAPEVARGPRKETVANRLMNHSEKYRAIQSGQLLQNQQQHGQQQQYQQELKEMSTSLQKDAMRPVKPSVEPAELAPKQRIQFYQPSPPVKARREPFTGPGKPLVDGKSYPQQQQKAQEREKQQRMEQQQREKQQHPQQYRATDATGLKTEAHVRPQHTRPRTARQIQVSSQMRPQLQMSCSGKKYQDQPATATKEEDPTRRHDRHKEAAIQQQINWVELQQEERRKQERLLLQQIQECQYERLKRHYHSQQQKLAHRGIISDQDLVVGTVGTSRTDSSTASTPRAEDKLPELPIQTDQFQVVPIKGATPLFYIPQPPQEPKPDRNLRATPKRPGSAATAVKHARAVVVNHDSDLQPNERKTPSDTVEVNSKLPPARQGSPPTPATPLVVGRLNHAVHTPSLATVEEGEELAEEEDNTEGGSDGGSSNSEANGTGSSSLPWWKDPAQGPVLGPYRTPAYLLQRDEEGEDWPEWINVNCQRPYSGKPQKWITFDDDTHRMVMKWCLTKPPLRPSPLVRDIELTDPWEPWNRDRDSPEEEEEREEPPQLCTDSREPLPQSVTQNPHNIRRVYSHQNPTEVLPLSHARGGSQLPISQLVGDRDRTPTAVPQSSSPVPRLDLSFCDTEPQRPAWDSEEAREGYKNYQLRLYNQAVNKCTNILDTEDDSRLRRFVGHKRLAEHIVRRNARAMAIRRGEPLEEEEQDMEMYRL